MAGRTSNLLIPELAGFRPEWLDSAEVSFPLNGPRASGLSFFFHDETSSAEFAEFAALDECVMADEKALRAKYGILPRYWLKIHFDGMKQCGLSQYLHINPDMHYPITTVRSFLRNYGLADAGIIEELLKPSLEALDTQWGLAIKRSPDEVVPRIFFSLSRPLLKQALAPFVRFGYLTEAAAFLYLEWENRLKGGDRVFVSLDPTLRRFSSLDFCALPSEQFPGAHNIGFPESFDYLKLRISESSRQPEFTAYMPLKKVRRSAHSSLITCQKLPPFRKGGPGGISTRQSKANPPISPFAKGGLSFSEGWQ